MSDVHGDFRRTRWPDSYQIGTEISPWQPYGGLDDYGNIIDWDEEFTALNMREMLRRDGKARAVESVISLPIRSESLNISAAKGDRGELEWLEQMLAEMATTLEDVVGWGVQSLIFRMSYLEKVFRHHQGRLVYDRLAWRPPEGCAAIHDKATGELLGYQQTLAGPDRFGLVEVPLRKGVVFIHGTNRDAMRGTSEMEVAYRCYSDKCKVRYLWASFLGASVVPRLVAETPPGMEEQVTTSLAALRNGGVASVPTGTKTTVLNVSGDAGKEFLSMMTYLDAEMAGSVLAGFTELSSAAGRGSRGSMALAQSETTFFANSLDTHAKEVAATIRRQVIAPIVRLNFGSEAAIPRAVIGPISPLSVQDAITALQTMASANATNSLVPEEFVEELVVKVAGMLELPMDRVAAAVARNRAMIEVTQPTTGAPTAVAHAGIATTAAMVKKARSGVDPLSDN